ncbi:TonB family protein [Acinetobacter guillouiae]|uniref:TonB family protein n=1 Tax=Acinetobacter guillouiae TaxID=106649 RepID=A0A8X8KCD7_ACIGI|nr:TonB family protein [Acinetobacter guillouiae]MCF0263859.1 TonB family protein [Acinetobacter guillouiae]
MSQSNSPYSLPSSLELKRWIGSFVATVATFTLITLVILWMLNQHPIDVVATSPTAPIVLEIAPLPTSLKHAQPTLQQKLIKQLTATPPINEEKPTPILNVKSSDTTADFKIAEKQTPIERKTPKIPQPKTDDQLQEQRKDGPTNEQNTAKTEDSLETANQKESTAAQNSGSSVSQSTSNTQWQSFVLAKLHKLKHYPNFAQRMNQEDTIMMQITMDSTGKVISSKILKSRGYQALDSEVKALIQRASPFSAPPTELIKNNKIELVVPIEFFIKNSQ